MIDEPLLIILDQDDDDDNYENENFDLSPTNTNYIRVHPRDEQQIIPNKILANEEQAKVEVGNYNESNNTSKNLHPVSQSSDKLEKSTTVPEPVVTTPPFTPQKSYQQRRTKSLSKQKNSSSSNNSKDLLAIDYCTDSVLSYISFTNIPNVLTISRMGSIYYCVEDLYLNVFSSYCTLDEFIDFLVKPDVVILKQVTLSEKISIEQYNSKLKHFSHTRYRLLSINATDYLRKLKEVLLKYKNNKPIDEIIDAMRLCKRISTPIQLNSNVSSPSLTATKRASMDDDDEQNKRLKIVTNEQELNETPANGSCMPYDDLDIVLVDEPIPANTVFAITAEPITKCLLPIEENHYELFPSNENINMWSTEYTSDTYQTCTSPCIENILPKEDVPDICDVTRNDLMAHEYAFSILSPLATTHSSNYSEPSTLDDELTIEYSSRSLSLPSIKFSINDNIMLQYQTSAKSVDFDDDQDLMPMIVNVEENVETNEPEAFQQSFTHAPNTLPFDNFAGNTPAKTSSSIHFPLELRSSTRSMRPLESPHNLHYRDSDLLSSLSENFKALPAVHHNTQQERIAPSNDNCPSSIMPSMKNQNNLNSPTTGQLPSCRLPYCTHQQTCDKSSLLDKSVLKSPMSVMVPSDERMIHRQYATSPVTTCDSSHTVICPNPCSSANRHPFHGNLNLVLSKKTYLARRSRRHSPAQNSLSNEVTHKSNIHLPERLGSSRDSSSSTHASDTTNRLTLPSICTVSVGLPEAIVVHGHRDIDKIPKLVVRYQKIYSSKTIDTTGQLFPSWFNEPDYRCVHCFTCDQVFTPQQFMTHVDDENMRNEQLLNITPIQLLSSEKLSQYKVDLWNQFCSNLANYASKLAKEETRGKRKKGLQGLIKLAASQEMETVES